MLEDFPRKKLCALDVQQGPKTPFWNVDYLLDLPQATLLEAIVVRTNREIEEQLGELVATDADAEIIERGLGAGEFPGKTHLVRITGDDCWRTLPQRVRRLLLIHEVGQRFDTTGALADVIGRRSDRQLLTLLNMWPERAVHILKQLSLGQGFDNAERLTWECYDTRGWYEVTSRLARGRGSVESCARESSRLLLSSGEKRQIRKLCAEVTGHRISLKKRICDIARTLRVADQVFQQVGPAPSASGSKPLSVGRLMGGLRQCIRFLAKNTHDVPLIYSKTGEEPQLQRCLAVQRELERIGMATRLIAAAL